MGTVIQIPSEDDLEATLVFKDQEVKINVIEFDDLVTQAYKDSQAAGDDDFLPYVQAAVKTDYSLDLPMAAVRLLLVNHDQRMTELKKKFSLLRDLLGSTESSPQDSINAASDTSP